MDPCTLVSNSTVALSSFDNCMIFSKRKDFIDLLIKSLFCFSENFALADKGSSIKGLGMETSKNKDKRHHARQLHLIDRIFNTVDFNDHDTN